MASTYKEDVSVYRTYVMRAIIVVLIDKKSLFVSLLLHNNDSRPASLSCQPNNVLGFSIVSTTVGHE